MKLPAKYLAARRALASATVAEAKTIRHKAMAMEVYAFQAKDAELMGHCVEIRKRAERRIGQLMAELREAGKLAKGGGGKRGRKRVDSGPALKAQGIDKHLADRSRRADELDEEAFERDVERAQALAIAAIVNASEVIHAAKADLHRKKKQRRDERERDLGKKIVSLPKKKYGVILADPEWKFEVWSERGLTNSSADNHYLTSNLDLIKARDVASIAADDAVLFLWATVPMLPQALEVVQAWGFKYVSAMFWDKGRAGTGYWVRNSIEPLLIATRGKIPAPAPGTQPESLIREAKAKHSAKPNAAYEIIERLFPSLPKIELNARPPHRDGWDVWGNEIEPVVESSNVLQSA